MKQWKQEDEEASASAVGNGRMPVRASQGVDRKIQMKESPGFHFTISLAPMLPLQDLFSNF